VLLAAVLVAACGDPVELNQVGGPTEPTTPTTPTTPSTPSQRPRRVLGIAEVTFADITTANMSATILVAPTVARLEDLRSGTVTSDQVASIRFERLATGMFKFTPVQGPAIRFVRASFGVNNLRSDSIVFDPAKENISFVAVRTHATIGTTPLRSIDRMDRAAIPAGVAEGVLPSELLAVSTEGQLFTLDDVLESLTPGQASRTESVAGATSLLPFGFVVQRPAVPTNPQSRGSVADGIVTFAFTLPLQVAERENITRLSVLFLIVNDTAPQSP
jgi:hypothetical protein